MSEENLGGLTEAETAYFESGGEKPLVVETPPAETARAEPPVEKTEPVETAEQKADRERDEKTGRFVPHGALHAEREERKKLQAERDELLQFRAAMQERFRIVEEQKAAQEKTTDQPPDEDDYVGTIKWLKDQYVAERQQRTQQSTAEREEQQARARVHAIYEEVDAEFRKAEAADPSLTEAYSYASKSFADELRATGVPERQIEPKLQEFAYRFAVLCKQNGYEPAEFAKSIAAARGWRPKEAPKKDEAAEKIAGIEKAMEQAKTIGAASGRAAGEPDSLESILAMSRTEFEQWHAKPENARRFEKLMGA